MSLQKYRALVCPCGGHLNNLIINLMRWLECRGQAEQEGARYRETFVWGTQGYCVCQFIYICLSLSHSPPSLVCQDALRHWLAGSCLSSCDTGNGEKRKCEDSQAEVAMATSQSSKHVFIYLFHYLSFFCCWRFLMRHTRDPLSRFRLGTLACWSDFVFNICNKWVFSFYLVPFKSSPGSTQCLQLCTMPKGPFKLCFYLLLLY